MDFNVGAIGTHTYTHIHTHTHYKLSLKDQLDKSYEKAETHQSECP